MTFRHELLLCPLLLAGCSSAAEQGARRELAQARAPSGKPPSEVSAPSEARAPSDASVHAPSPDGTRATPANSPAAKEAGLGRYTAIAMENSPALRAAFERWQASVHRISKARTLPDPKFSFGYFVSAVETRVGPQRARLSLQQSFPWPTALTAGADAASAQARAQQRMFEGLALAVKLRVASTYYKLWLTRETRAIHREHLVVLRSLSETVLARVATGTTTLSDQLQVDLAAARLEDNILGMDEAEHAAAAELNSVLGAPGPPGTPTPDAPVETEVPLASVEELSQAAKTHPLLASYEQMALAQEETARAKGAARLPSFTIGADWIITGQARMPDVADSGKDAVIVGGGISVPLWQGSYGKEQDAAHAEASAQRAERKAAEDRAVGELYSSLSAVRDAARRVNSYRHTLIPQAEAAYDSVLGSYSAGRSTTAQTLLAQRDILELKGELAKARADHAQAWARLENVVGHELDATTREEVSGDPDDRK